MKQFLFLLTLLCIGIVPTFAQVTIDRADIESQVGVTIESRSWDANDNVSGSPMPDTTGLYEILNGGAADFTSIVSGLLKNGEFELLPMPQDVAGVDSFSTATHVEEIRLQVNGIDSTLHRFLTLNDNGFVYDGTVILIDIDQNGTPEPIVVRYEPNGWELRKFPFGTGSMWETSFTQVSWVTVPVIGAYRAEGSVEEREYEVTGTATLTTPSGSSPAVVAHIFEFITLPMGTGRQALERYSFIAENGHAVTVAWDIDFDTRARLALNDIAYFIPQETTSVEAIAGEASANGVSLGNSYPNPISGHGAIPFTIERAGHVHLALYNSIGEQVMVLVDAPMGTGDHVADFNADALPNGVYTCRLQVGERVVSNKVVVQK